MPLYCIMGDEYNVGILGLPVLGSSPLTPHYSKKLLARLGLSYGSQRPVTINKVDHSHFLNKAKLFVPHPSSPLASPLYTIISY